MSGSKLGIRRWIAPLAIAVMLVASFGAFFHTHGWGESPSSCQACHFGHAGIVEAPQTVVLVLPSRVVAHCEAPLGAPRLEGEYLPAAGRAPPIRSF